MPLNLPDYHVRRLKAGYRAQQDGCEGAAHGAEISRLMRTIAVSGDAVDMVDIELDESQENIFTSSFDDHKIYQINIESGMVTTVATGINEPTAIIRRGNYYYVAEWEERNWRAFDLSWNRQSSADWRSHSQNTNSITAAYYEETDNIYAVDWIEQLIYRYEFDTDDPQYDTVLTPPVAVPGGFDGWYGITVSPTGRVMLARGYQNDYTTRLGQVIVNGDIDWSGSYDLANNFLIAPVIPNIKFWTKDHRQILILIDRQAKVLRFICVKDILPSTAPAATAVARTVEKLVYVNSELEKEEVCTAFANARLVFHNPNCMLPPPPPPTGTGCGFRIDTALSNLESFEMGSSHGNVITQFWVNSDESKIYYSYQNREIRIFDMATRNANTSTHERITSNVTIRYLWSDGSTIYYYNDSSVIYYNQLGQAVDSAATSRIDIPDRGGTAGGLRGNSTYLYAMGSDRIRSFRLSDKAAVTEYILPTHARGNPMIADNDHVWFLLDGIFRALTADTLTLDPNYNIDANDFNFYQRIGALTRSTMQFVGNKVYYLHQNSDNMIRQDIVLERVNVNHGQWMKHFSYSPSRFFGRTNMRALAVSRDNNFVYAGVQNNNSGYSTIRRINLTTDGTTAGAAGASTDTGITIFPPGGTGGRIIADSIMELPNRFYVKLSSDNAWQAYDSNWQRQSQHDYVGTFPHFYWGDAASRNPRHLVYHSASNKIIGQISNGFGIYNYNPTSGVITFEQHLEYYYPFNPASPTGRNTIPFDEITISDNTIVLQLGIIRGVPPRYLFLVGTISDNGIPNFPGQGTRTIRFERNRPQSDRTVPTLDINTHAQQLADAGSINGAYGGGGIVLLRRDEKSSLLVESILDTERARERAWHDICVSDWFSDDN